MPAKTANSPANDAWIALFDLDGTLTWRDTLLPYLVGFVRRRPLRAFGLWRLPWGLYRYWRDRDRGALKSAVIRMLMRGEKRAALDAWSRDFVAAMKPHQRFRPIALAVLETHKASGDRLVLLSASPDLYVPLIGELLGFERTLCTELQWNGERLDGGLKTPNRRGEEKAHCLAWLRTQYPGTRVIAYGNSASDIDHMREADRALLVNGNAEARRLADLAGIGVSYWN